MKNLKRVLIMAGGTGGHVYPALALANYLREQGVEVHWLGTQQGLEARVIPPTQIPLHLISIGGVRGKNLKTLLTAPFHILKATVQSLRLLRRLKPDMVIGLGGFVSGPGGVASWLLRCPLVIHESNAKAGLTNRWLSTISKKVLTGFPNVFASQDKVVMVGNPVRSEIANLAPPAQRFANRPKKMRLLVFGGSLGAQAINQIVPRVMAQLEESERPEIYHQTGVKLFDEAEKLYRKAGIEAKVVPYISDMHDAYEWADIVLCRSGALTVAELCAAGLGSILIPFPHATDDHQTPNAEYLVKAGAAYLIQQRDLTDSGLLQIIKGLQASPQKRLAMAEAAYRLRKVKVSEEIFELCLTV
jgi:UDP-N-acetylglucosamine--N-acetylmuramyl-(pentapeptide) pyrophosphoryl-undecaprenol N-acetylglucosamine transferase